MIQYLVKNQVDRIQCNDSEDGLKFWLRQLSNFGVIEIKELSFSTFNLKRLDKVDFIYSTL